MPKLLLSLVEVVWTKTSIPSEWQRTVAVAISKRLDSKTFSHFMSVALLNMEGKSTMYLIENKYNDTN